jgi:hypothetical protein
MHTTNRHSAIQLLVYKKPSRSPWNNQNDMNFEQSPWYCIPATTQHLCAEFLCNVMDPIYIELCNRTLEKINTCLGRHPGSFIVADSGPTMPECRVLTISELRDI